MKKKNKTKMKKFKITYERSEGISDEEAQRRIFAIYDMILGEDLRRQFSK